MRILVLNWKDLSHPAAGGAEVFTHEITRAWATSGHDVSWFSANVDGRPALEVVDGVTHVRTGGRFSVYSAARRYVEDRGAHNWDLVIDEVNTRPFLTPTWLRGAPAVALIHQLCREIWWHEVPLPVAAAGRFLLERRWLAHYAEVPVLTVSASSKDSLESYGLRHVTVVPQGTRASARPHVARERVPTVLFVGRLASNKRPADALTAFRRLRRHLPDAQLWMVGDGPQLSSLRRRAGAGVTFFGRVDEQTKRQLMARAHVLVATSVREGWGLVVDEAAAMGTPTIAYDVPGLRDSVPAAGGLLVPPRPDALAGKLVDRLHDLVSAPAVTGWTGGALPWPNVAEAVLAECLAPAPSGTS